MELLEQCDVVSLVKTHIRPRKFRTSAPYFFSPKIHTVLFDQFVRSGSRPQNVMHLEDRCEFPTGCATVGTKPFDGNIATDRTVGRHKYSVRPGPLRFRIQRMHTTAASHGVNSRTRDPGELRTVYPCTRRTLWSAIFTALGLRMKMIWDEPFRPAHSIHLIRGTAPF